MDFSYDLYNGIQSYSKDSESYQADSLTPSEVSRGSTASSSRNQLTVNSDKSEKVVYHPDTGMFQPEGANTASKKNSNAKSSGKAFSSMPSSMNRPRGSVFQKALFSVGIQTKDSRMLTAAESGDLEAVSGFLSSGANPNWQNNHGETALIYASWKGYEPIVAALLDHPATHVNMQDNEGWTALMWAAKAGHDGVVRIFLVHPDTEPDLANNLGETALMKASVQAHARVVKLLSSSYRTVVNKTHPDGSTALLWASAGGSIKCVSILLDAGANINISDNDGMDSLMWAVSVGHVDIVEYLLQRGCNVKKVDKVGRSPLLMAAEVGHAEVASFLLQHDEIDVNTSTKDKISALMRSSGRGHSPLVNMLTKCKDIDVNMRDSQGKTALIYASRSGHFHCTSILIQHSQIDINIQDNEGCTATMYAAQNGHVDALEALLKCPNNEVTLTTRKGMNALSLASKSGHKLAVKALLQHKKIDINSVDDHKMTALAWATRNGSVLVVELLQQYQSLDPNIANSEGTTPLIWAVKINNFQVVQTLVRDSRVDPTLTDKQGKTALVYAVENDYEEIVHCLRRFQSISRSTMRIKKSRTSSNSSDSDDSDSFHSPAVIASRFASQDPDIDTVSDVDRYLDNGPLVNWRPKSGKTSFTWAVASGQTEVVKVFLLVPTLDVNQEDFDGFTPLMIASKQGHFEVVRLLLHHEKTDVNRADRLGRTAFMMAALNGHIRTVCVLLSCQHLKVNLQDTGGNTSLHLAAQNGIFEIVRAILKHNQTNASLKTNEGSTALIHAIRGGHNDVAELLLERNEIDVNAVTEKGESALLLAAGYQGSIRLTTSLLKHQKINVNLTDLVGHTALALCARNNHLECARLLLDQQDTNVNLQDNEGMSALMYATLFGNDDIIRIMFSHPATNPNLKCKENGSTALLLAARNNRISALEILTSRNNVNVNIADDFNSTALNHAVRRNCKENVCLLLERDDIDVNTADVEGKSPLLRACSHGYYILAQILLDRNDVDVNKKTMEGKTALMYSAQRPDGLETLHQILGRKDVQINLADDKENTAIMHACKNGNVLAVDAILNNCSVKPQYSGKHHLLKEKRDEQGYTVLMWAAILGFTEIVRTLLKVEVGIEINAYGPDGLTALGLASELGHVNVVQILASHPTVDINAGEDRDDGRTAIVAGLEKCQHESVCILLQHPSHSLVRSKIRVPYLPPTLKTMVDIYRQNHEIRNAFILCCGYPSTIKSLPDDKESTLNISGAVNLGSALLSLPRPFQVVQHILEKGLPAALAKHILEFTHKLNPDESGAVVMFLSGEILITPEGPAICLSSLSSPTAPTNVLLSSLISSMSFAKTLILLVDVLSVVVTPSLQHATDIKNNPSSYVLPPLLHDNMAVLMCTNDTLNSSTGSSSFSDILCREILHGVTLQQLHQRVASSLLHRKGNHEEVPAEGSELSDNTQDTTDSDLETKLEDTPMFGDPFGKFSSEAKYKPVYQKGTTEELEASLPDSAETSDDSPKENHVDLAKGIKTVNSSVKDDKNSKRDQINVYFASNLTSDWRF